MISNVLEDADLLRLMNSQRCLCKQTFGRRGELYRHLQQQHATIWVDTPDLAQSIPYTGDPPSNAFACHQDFVQPKLPSIQVALLMKHEQIEYSSQLMQMDRRYAATVEAARHQGIRNMSAASGTRVAYTELDPNCCEKTTTAGDTHSHFIMVTQDPPLDSADDPHSGTEDRDQLWDYDLIVSRADAMILDLQSEEFLHWYWILTTDMSSVSDELLLSDTYRTLYPTTSTKPTGGYYARWLDDPSIVRMLRTRCCLCDAMFTNGTDMLSSQHCI